jgi:hypothetical protein
MARKLNPALAKIVKEAKKIKAKNPKYKWTDCIKKASKK